MNYSSTSNRASCFIHRGYYHTRREQFSHNVHKRQVRLVPSLPFMYYMLTHDISLCFCHFGECVSPRNILYVITKRVFTSFPWHLPRSEATCKQITWPKANLQVQNHLHRYLLYDLYIGRWTATPARRPADQAGVYLLIVVVAMTRLIHCLTSIHLTYYCELAICQGVSFNFSLPPGQAGRK